MKVDAKWEGPVEETLDRLIDERLQSDFERPLERLCEQAKLLCPDQALSDKIGYRIDKIDGMEIPIYVRPREALPYFRTAHEMLRGSFPEYLNNILERLLNQKE